MDVGYSSALAQWNEKRLPEGSLFSKFNRKLAVGDVHRYFEAKTHFGVLGLGPHDLDPLESINGGVCKSDSHIVRFQRVVQQRKTRKSRS